MENQNFSSFGWSVTIHKIFSAVVALTCTRLFCGHNNRNSAPVTTDKKECLTSNPQL